MKIIYEPAAYEELREAIVWYLAEAGQRQAEALSRDIDARLALLMQHPQLGTPGASNMRRMPLRASVIATLTAMRIVLARGKLPVPTDEKQRCRECSLREPCQPEAARADIQAARAALFNPDA